MIAFFDRLARPLLRALQPEDAHSLVIKALKLAPLPQAAPDDPRLAVRGVRAQFPQPGRAARRASTSTPTRRTRCCGWVSALPRSEPSTPLPQPGNPRPRLFRLDPDQAVINRFGFNSVGADVVLPRLAARAKQGGIVGVNVGANKDSADRATDYVRLIEQVAPIASYVTVNISSPNTPGLRELQRASVLDSLLARIVETRDRVARNAGPTPVLLKIAPDLSLSDLDDIVGVARRAPDRRHDRRQHHDRPSARVCAIRRPRRRPAGSPASRFTRWRRACSPRLMFGSKARSR